MKEFHNYRLRNESWEAQCAARRHNPATEMVLRWRGKGLVCTLACGSNDDISVYTEGGLLYVVTVNHSLDYCGLEVFDPTITTDDKGRVMSQVGETFLQFDYEIAEILGPRGVDLHPRNIAKRLADYAMA